MYVEHLGDPCHSSGGTLPSKQALGVATRGCRAALRFDPLIALPWR
jgi:hypothetical protein